MDRTTPTDPHWQLPPGFLASGIHCGIKADGLDLAVLAGRHHVTAAGVFTQNLVRASCIDWNRDHTPSDFIRAVVINSGNANACTGEQGLRNTHAMAALVAESLSARGDPVTAEQVLVLSTGVIGVQLPMEKLAAGIPIAVQQLSSDAAAFLNAARAIMTTDHHHKVAQYVGAWDDRQFRIFGICKGAGMIGPNMATMLAVIMTDFPLTPSEAEACIHHAADHSFNRISVEGHTSTNDCALLLAPPNHLGDSEVTAARDRQLYVFQQGLDDVCLQLALQIPSDGEGATHLIEIRVTGCADNHDADRIARTIGLSNLVKTAIAGADPNWGRIVSAAGYAGVDFNPRDVSLKINGLSVFSRGQPSSFDARQVSQSIASSRRTLIELDVGTGEGEGVHWTSDLTAAYVKLNAEYTT